MRARVDPGSDPHTRPTDTMFLPRRLPPASWAIAPGATSDERDSYSGVTRDRLGVAHQMPVVGQLLVVQVEGLLVEADQQVDRIALRERRLDADPGPGTCTDRP